LRNVSHSDISWIGSVQACLLLIIGAATGPLFDHGFFHILLPFGSFLVVFGMFMTSLCTRYWQFMLTQGIIIGVGSGCLFVPSIALVSAYFTTKKSFVTGIVASGSSFGGIAYPILFARLQPSIRFPNATRVIAFLMLGMLLFCFAVMRVRSPPSQKRRLLDINAFRSVPFAMFSFGGFFGFMGLYIPFFYMESFVVSKGVMSQQSAFYMLPLLNMGSIFGRVIPCFLADRINPLHVLFPFTIAVSLLAFCWIPIETPPPAIAFCILYGFCSGALPSLIPAAVASLSPSLDDVGTRMGMNFSMAGLGLLVGAPVAGAILRPESHPNWIGAQLFCGLALVLAAAFILLARLIKLPDLAPM
jgi:MFS family permease